MSKLNNVFSFTQKLRYINSMKFKGRLIKTVLLLILLPTLIFSIKTILDLRKSASGTYANISVDTNISQGSIPSSLWQNLSQGGESKDNILAPVSPLITKLKPRLIRIDHIFDFYDVYQDDQKYDFSKLDKIVETITSTGAVPMLSLSYTPNGMNQNDWSKWSNLVQATAHHYSIEKNISGIYYEVWNEPDLFGGWHYAKNPSYTELYTQSARAVAQGAQKSSYKIGGPATTAFYENWIKSLFSTAQANNLRLDFISWHKYSKNMDDFDKEFDSLNKILSSYPNYFDVERVITEIGPDPENNTPWYENHLSGIHLLSLATRLSGKIHKIFPFEIIDGPTSNWGIISREGKTKPRYQAIVLLNLLSGQRLSSSGDGSWVTSLASKYGSKIQLLLVNYDPKNIHSESVPFTINGLRQGSYTLKTEYYLGKTVSKKIVVQSSAYSDTIYMDPNSALLMELSPIIN